MRIPLLGLGYLGAVLEKAGFSVRIIDPGVEDIPADKIVEEVVRHRPGLVGVSSMTPNIKTAANLAGLISKALPGVSICVGGPHVTALPEETLKEFPSFDFGICGEGEGTLVNLAQNLSRGRSAPETLGNLAFRDRGRVVVNAKAPEVHIDELPFPAWHLYPKSKVYQLYTARGCPFKCTFCMRVLGQKVRYRNIDSVIDEFEWVVKDYGPEWISIADETFTLGKERVEDFCRRLIGKNLHRKVKWSCNSRANLADGELYKLLYEAGCKAVGFGIESGNEGILKKINKNITVKQAMNAIGLAKAANLKTMAYFILGCPGETEDTVRETVGLATRLNTFSVSFGIMVPYPGTEIYNDAVKGQGYSLLSRDWDFYDKQFGRVLEFENLPSRYLESAQRKAYREFYLKNRRFFDLSKMLWARRNIIFQRLFGGREVPDK